MSFPIQTCKPTVCNYLQRNFYNIPNFLKNQYNLFKESKIQHIKFEPKIINISFKLSIYF